MTDYNKAILMLNNRKNWKEKNIIVGDIKNTVKEIIKLKLSLSDSTFEPQLLTQEFVEIKLYDYYGNYYIYNPFYLQNGVNTVKVIGTVSDNNNVFFGIKNYKENNVNSNNISSDFRNEGFRKKDFMYGFFDKTLRNIPIITEQTESYMQQNFNQIESTNQSFKENKSLIEQSNKLNFERTSLSNEIALANLDYSLTESIGNGIMGFGFSDTIHGKLGSLVNTGFGIYNNRRLYGQQQELNELSLEQVTLSALQSKTNYNQSLRNFNAKLKDLDNQPVAVSNIGSDLSMQLGSNLDGLYIDIDLGNDYTLKVAYDYFKMYGVFLNKFFNNMTDLLSQREKFNYIKFSNVVIKNTEIVQSHLEMIKNILISGVRIWNYEENLDFKNYDILNEDK